LCGTSLALAENVFIFEKGHENYRRHKWLSTCGVVHETHE